MEQISGRGCVVVGVSLVSSPDQISWSGYETLRQSRFQTGNWNWALLVISHLGWSCRNGSEF